MILEDEEKLTLEDKLCCISEDVIVNICIV